VSSILQSLLSYCIHLYFSISVKGTVVAFYFFEELFIIVTTLNWLDITSTFLTLTMFVIVELQTVSYMSLCRHVYRSTSVQDFACQVPVVNYFSLSNQKLKNICVCIYIYIYTGCFTT
jgi:hypothetical protein